MISWEIIPTHWKLSLLIIIHYYRIAVLHQSAWYACFYYCGKLLVVFGYRLTRRPRRRVFFLLSYTSMLWWGGVGLGGLGLIRFLGTCTPTWCMLEMGWGRVGWGGVGLITFLGLCAPTWSYVRDEVGWDQMGLITFLGTCTPTWCYVRDGVGWGGVGIITSCGMLP